MLAVDSSETHFSFSLFFFFSMSISPVLSLSIYRGRASARLYANSQSTAFEKPFLFFLLLSAGCCWRACAMSRWLSTSVYSSRTACNTLLRSKVHSGRILSVCNGQDHTKTRVWNIRRHFIYNIIDCRQGTQGTSRCTLYTNAVDCGSDVRATVGCVNNASQVSLSI